MTEDKPSNIFYEFPYDFEEAFEKAGIKDILQKLYSARAFPFCIRKLTKKRVEVFDGDRRLDVTYFTIKSRKRFNGRMLTHFGETPVTVSTDEWRLCVLVIYQFLGIEL